jgi:hypothetical protein
VALVTGHNVASGNLAHPATGVLCISGLSFTPANIVANASSTSSSVLTTTSGIQSQVSNAACAAGTQAWVDLWSNGNNPALTNGTLILVMN